ncbi:hypothetical protein M378DRAFT_67556 [Amanita muscaria Koide BX008]|uniref:Uncharacterized protein n=1 Tax=Amanita muscaria (strain Koide BX008) TaxID=946122 RepID=A0A0C2XLC4_AMAMK|nr:hypothetical protein M378DRAFT_67556 [Amanita muscaria Koide BX008]
MPSSPLFAHSPHDVLADTPYLNLPVMTMRTTALQVCYSVYGESPMSLDVVDRCYENNAGKSLSNLLLNTHLTAYLPHYENPFVTATSKEVISDIHRLARQLGAIDVPRPLALIFALFGLQPPKTEVNKPLFQALRVWNDIGDICDCEMFDGHRKTIVEHTLNILLLPGIHHDGFHRHPLDDATESLATATDSFGLRLPPVPRFALPSLPVPGTSLSVPSPLHFKIHILTSLSFNEQGYVTRHCDYWDLKDLMGLVPGVSLAQWIMSRLTATGLSYAARLLQRPKMPSYATHVSDPSSLRLGTIHPNALGLEGIP